jgi:hypothetical protein
MRIAILEMQHRRRRGKQEEVANESGSLCTKDYILAKIGQEWCNRKISYYFDE